jgi:hypothetical protein
MIWIEFTVEEVEAHLPTDLRALYDNWIASYPEKAHRLEELTSNTLREFRDALKSVATNRVDPRETYLPQSAIRHAENIVIFTLAMEMGVQLTTSANSARTSADVFLRQLPLGRWTATTEDAVLPSPLFVIPDQLPAYTRVLAMLFVLLLPVGVWGSWIRPGSETFDTSVMVTFKPFAYSNTTVTLFGHLQGLNTRLSDMQAFMQALNTNPALLGRDVISSGATSVGPFGLAVGDRSAAETRGAAFGQSTIAGAYGVAAGMESVAGSYGLAVGEATVAGNYGLSAGRRARAGFPGVFLYADAQNEDFNAVTNNEFAVRSSGGTRFVTPRMLVSGELRPGSVRTASIHGQDTSVGTNAVPPLVIQGASARSSGPSVLPAGGLILDGGDGMAPELNSGGKVLIRGGLATHMGQKRGEVRIEGSVVHITNALAYGTFAGNGAGLSNVPASSITGVLTGNAAGLTNLSVASGALLIGGGTLTGALHAGKGFTAHSDGPVIAWTWKPQTFFSNGQATFGTNITFSAPFYQHYSVGEIRFQTKNIQRMAIRENDVVFHVPLSGSGAGLTNLNYAAITNAPVLGSMAAQAAESYALTNDLAPVAYTGSYDDLDDRPALGTMASEEAGAYQQKHRLPVIGQVFPREMSWWNATGIVNHHGYPQQLMRLQGGNFRHVTAPIPTTEGISYTNVVIKWIIRPTGGTGDTIRINHTLYQYTKDSDGAASGVASVNGGIYSYVVPRTNQYTDVITYQYNPGSHTNVFYRAAWIVRHADGPDNYSGDLDIVRMDYFFQ